MVFIFYLFFHFLFPAPFRPTSLTLARRNATFEASFEFQMTAALLEQATALADGPSPTMEAG